MRLMTPDTLSSRSPAGSKIKQMVTASSSSSSPSPTSSKPTPTSAGMPTGLLPSRRRTLRTYGKKRPLADDADEDSRQPAPQAPQAGTVNAASDRSEASPKKQKKSGILRYFQPAPLPRGCVLASSSSSQCSVGETDQSALRGSTPLTAAPEPISAAAVGSGTRPPSPPLTPPTTRRPRQKRRLMMRPGVPEDEFERKKAAGDPQTAVKQENHENSGSGGMTASSVRMRARMTARLLGMCGREGHEQQIPARKKAPRPAPATQTTLSLTIGGDAMKECRECNILYNPLHEKDAKFHARYHASLRRKRARQSRETAAW